jgi:hypothetical protein
MLEMRHGAYIACNIITIFMVNTSEHLEWYSKAAHALLHVYLYVSLMLVFIYTSFYLHYISNAQYIKFSIYLDKLFYKNLLKYLNLVISYIKLCGILTWQSSKS